MMLSLRIAFRAAQALALLVAAATGIAGAQTLTANPTTLSFFHQVGANSPPQQNIELTSSSPIAASVTSSIVGGGGWLVVPPIVSITPITIPVLVVPTGLAPGNYSGIVTITAQGAANSPLNIPISLVVSTSPLLISNRTSIPFTTSIGGAAPANQTISLTSTTPGIAFTMAAVVTSGGNWLTATPSSGTTPATLTLSANPAGLPIGTYSATITIAAAAALNSPLQIPATLTITDEIRLNLSPSSLTYDFQIGGPVPQDRAISITSTGAAIGYTAVAASTGNWLSIAGATGATPGNLTVSINPTGLTAGTHAGTITITAPGAVNTPQTVNVTFRVFTDPLFSATPASLQFTSQTGGTAVPRQIAVLSNFGNSVPFTLDVSTTSGGTWLNARPAAASSPAAITVGVTPGALPAGVYEGAVTVTGQAGNSPFRIPVTMVLTAQAGLRVSANYLNFAFQTGGSNPVPRTLSVSSTTAGTAVDFTASAVTMGGGPWLSVAPAAGRTPADLTVSVNPTGLGPGVYSGSVTVLSTVAGSSAVSIPVGLVVSNAPLLVAPAGPLEFSFAAGGAPPANQSLAISSTGAALNFNVATRTATATNWLVSSPVSGVTGGSLTIGVNQFGLAEGTFTGVVTITSPEAANSPLHVPVVFTVSTAADLVVTPAPLVFNQLIGAAAAPPQILNITSTGIILPFNTRASTHAGGNWLGVSPTGGLTPGLVSVSVNATGLDPGSYAGFITVESSLATNSPRIVPVTLNVTRPRPALNLTSNSLTFNANAGGPAPAAQNVQLTSAGDPVTFSLTASGGAWLSANTSSTVTPATLTITANPAGLAPGNYSGSVRVESAGASNTPLTINVSLTVVAQVSPTLTAFVNAASFQPGPAVPGMIVTLFGTLIGPTTPVTLQLTPQGTVATTLAETRILFDGIPAPLIAVSSTQSSAVVPYRIDGRLSTRVQVEYRGVLSNAIELRVAESFPGIFSSASSGQGQGAVLNQDATVNSAANPAARGSIIVVYATGEGQTRPGGEDGTVAGATLKRPLLGVSARIGGRPAEVLYAGSAPGLISGVFQLNLRVPEDVTPGPGVALDITVGTAASQSGITVAIR
jgi:uncharacterized protein (TIGR03437 family)